MCLRVFERASERAGEEKVRGRGRCSIERQAISHKVAEESDGKESLKEGYARQGAREDGSKWERTAVEGVVLPWPFFFIFYPSNYPNLEDTTT